MVRACMRCWYQRRMARYAWCIDYTALNNKTITDKHPLPNISAMFLQRLEGTAYFLSSLTLASGYYHFKQRQTDIEKRQHLRPPAAAAAANGLYEFVRMPMGAVECTSDVPTSEPSTTT